MTQHVFRSSLAGAMPIAMCFGYLYGSALSVLGIFAFLWAAFVAFLVTLCFAHLFLAIRKRIGEPFYLLLHLAAGYGLGMLFASVDTQTDSFEELYTSRETMLPLVASMAAWSYLFLFDTLGKRFDGEGAVAAKLLLLFVVCLALSYLPISRPYIESDSCHNVLRDQRSSNSPIESIRLTLPLDAEPTLRAIYDTFAGKHGLDAAGHPIHKDSAQTSMCSEAVTIKAGGFFEGRHGIRIFEMSPGSEWRELTQTLVCELNEVWPNSISFSDGRSHQHDEQFELIANCRPRHD